MAGAAMRLRDISPYAAGNTGVPYVWSFKGVAPGPHVMVNALTHGNEPAGMWAVTRLLDEGLRPARGRLTMALANVAAYGRLFAGAAGVWRFVDRDLNRIWSDAWLAADRSSSEAARARELRPILREVDALLDLHTTAYVARPFLVIAEFAKTRALADRMRLPPTQQLMPGGCAEGRHLTDYGRFADPAAAAVAVSVECGRHDDPASADMALRVARRFLQATGVVAADAAEMPAATPIERFRTVGPCVARTDAFTLAIPRTGFVEVAAGTVVATDGGEPVRAPRDLVVVSPRPAPMRGETAFLWCERV